MQQSGGLDDTSDNHQRTGNMWRSSFLRYKISLEKPSLVPNRPQTTMQPYAKSRSLATAGSISLQSTTSHPISEKSRESRLQSYKDAFTVTHRSFDAHFKRQKEAINTFEAKAWDNSQRLYKRKLEKMQMKRHELDPVPILYDECTTETILAQRNRERKRCNLPDDYQFRPHQLPPEKTTKMPDRHRVFFWG